MRRNSRPPRALGRLALAAGALVVAFGLVAPGVASAGDKTVVRRFALITGASQGGTDRVPLRFADSDARAVARVLGDLGGVGSAETILLLELGRAQLRSAFDRVRDMVTRARAPGARTEVVFYYSGHSDEGGLLLGAERVSYPEIRSWVDETGADVRIAVLDSCASGALTRGKGGVHRPPFLVDTSSAARGHAYLTASAENEAAQESDRLGAAYFTHYLVSGLRGAADVSHDGRVTLSEAYQYAFTETLARTEASRGGPQHASYDFQLAGKGDLVMTDLRATSASLVLPAELSGRLFVRDAEGRLVAEVHKLPAQPIEIGLPPGRYRVTLDDSRRLSETTVELVAGQPSALSVERMVAMVPSRAVARGAAPAPSPRDGAYAEEEGTLVAHPAPQPGWYALNLSIFPGFDTNAGVPAHNKLVLGFGAQSASVEGLALTLGHRSFGDVRGTQIGALLNVAGGSVRGTQLAGILNTAGGDVHGFQAAGVLNSAGGGAGLQAAGVANVLTGDHVGAQIAGFGNLARANMKGIQLAGATNTVQGDVEGIQIAGAANVDQRDAKGIQVAGAANVTRGDVEGSQVAGAVNFARNVTGAQIAVVNVGGEVDGVQLGVVNVARRARGLQLGLVNVASESGSGASIGLVTFARDGIHELELSTTEGGGTVLAGVLGTRHVFTRLGVGVLGAPGDIPGGRAAATGASPSVDRKHYLIQWGFGGRLRFGERWFVDGEAVGWQFMRDRRASSAADRFESEDAVLASARVVVGFHVLPHLTVVAGPTYNVLVGWGGTDLVTSGALAESVIHDGATTVRMYPGLLLGVRI